MLEPKIAQKAPYEVELKEGQKVFWCACGHSAKQPFCDGAHAKNNTGMKPIAYTAEKGGKVHLCGCKHTKGAPHCDGTHKAV